jgi:hypothetical protein
LQKNADDDEAAKLYTNLYRKKFLRRLRICQLIRQSFFVPNLAQKIIPVLNLSRTMQKIIVSATRENRIFSRNGM